MRFPEPGDVVAVHEATSQFEAIAIRDLLEAAGVLTMVRSRVVPGYEVRDMWGDKAGVVADILVRPEDETAARALIADYLKSLDVDSLNAGGPDTGPPNGASGKMP
jgi:hypothetical protein